MPVIATASDGFSLELRPVPLADGRLRLSCDLRHTRLARPISSLTTTLGGLHQEVTIQLPQTTLVRAAGHFELRPGATLMLAADDPVGEQRAGVVRVVIGELT